MLVGSMDFSLSCTDTVLVHDIVCSLVTGVECHTWSRSDIVYPCRHLVFFLGSLSSASTSPECRGEPGSEMASSSCSKRAVKSLPTLLVGELGSSPLTSIGWGCD